MGPGVDREGLACGKGEASASSSRDDHCMRVAVGALGVDKVVVRGRTARSMLRPSP